MNTILFQGYLCIYILICVIYFLFINLLMDCPLGSQATNSIGRARVITGGKGKKGNALEINQRNFLNGQEISGSHVARFTSCQVANALGPRENVNQLHWCDNSRSLASKVCITAPMGLCQISVPNFLSYYIYIYKLLYFMFKRWEITSI